MTSEYGLLALALTFPGDALAAASRDGSLAGAFGPLPGLHDPSAERSAFEEEYIRLFELPTGGPTCPLYTGVYAHSRREAMEELLRFYHHAGLCLSEAARDLPDAVPTVLEFLGFLSWQEESSPATAEASRRTAGDILHRHLLPWLDETRSRLPKREPGPFYAAILEALSAFATAEHDRTAGALAAR
ncbi:MAG: molecular chaperone TorD family protein [Chloroflexi bacterium]|nr:molecular chaperone TorD family protein [Chloroflexota bacterium]